jgi:hypothetical protein
MVKVKVRGIYLSISSILCFKFIWIDEIQTITETKIVQWQNIIYIEETGFKGSVLFSFFIPEKSLMVVCILSV